MNSLLSFLLPQSVIHFVSHSVGHYTVISGCSPLRWQHLLQHNLVKVRLTMLRTLSRHCIEHYKLSDVYLIYGEPGYVSRYSDSLQARRSGDRIPVGARFSAPVQTGPGAHPASYTMGTGSFPGVKRPGRDVDHPPHLAPKSKKEQSSPSGPSWSVIG